MKLIPAPLAFLLLGVLVMLFSCRQSFLEEIDDTVVSDSSTVLGGLTPPNGFTFETSREVSFQVTVKADDDAVLPGVNLVFYTADPDANGTELFRGVSNSQGVFRIDFEIPSHLDTVFLKTDFIGLIPSHTLVITNNSVNFLLQNSQLKRARPKTGLKSGPILKSGDYVYLGSYNSQGVPDYLEPQDDIITADLLNLVNTNLPEGRPVPTYNPQYIDENVQPNTVLIDSAEVWVTFVHEGAGWRNGVGYYVYDTGNPPNTRDDIDSLYIIFPNCSYEGHGGGLYSGNRVSLGNFPAGKTIGWFLAPNAWNSGTQLVNSSSEIKFSNKELNTYTSADFRNHIVLLKDDARRLQLLSFEDITRPSGDNDFNDAVFFVTASPYEALQTTDVVSTAQVNPVLDQDSDGIIDTYDAFPEDNQRAFVFYSPSEDINGSLGFEDLWPNLGDYDFNDIVVDYNYTFIANAAQEVVEIQADFELRAVGASLSNGFGIELGIAPSNIASVTGSQLTESYINLSANGTEAGQDKAVIIVFDNAHAQFSKPGGTVINTRTTSPVFNPIPIQINIQMSQPVRLSQLGVAPYNPFIIVDGVRGHEVHLLGEPPTSLVDASLFGTSVDVSDPAQGIYYQTKQNLPFAIHIPVSFDYPLERVEIIQGYQHFATWASGGDLSFKDWYLPKTNYRRDQHIYYGSR